MAKSPSHKEKGLVIVRRTLAVAVAVLFIALVPAAGWTRSRPQTTPSPSKDSLMAKVLRLRAGGLVVAVEPLRDAGPAGWTAPQDEVLNFEVLGHSARSGSSV